MSLIIRPSNFLYGDCAERCPKLPDGFKIIMRPDSWLMAEDRLGKMWIVLTDRLHRWITPEDGKPYMDQRITIRL